MKINSKATSPIIRVIINGSQKKALKVSVYISTVGNKPR